MNRYATKGKLAVQKRQKSNHLTLHHLSAVTRQATERDNLKSMASFKGIVNSLDVRLDVSIKQVLDGLGCEIMTEATRHL